MKNDTQGEVAAIILEPMQGTAGNVIPPDDFIHAVREIADEFGALLIADEILTGFGRTGTMWASEQFDMNAPAFATSTSWKVFAREAADLKVRTT